MGISNEKERMRQILSVFFNHGIKRGFRGENLPVGLRESFEELGSTFIKIGQILSTRSDLLPDTFTTELQKLQDNVQPETYTDIIKVIEDAFGKPVGEMFLWFDREPLATASIAQVHLACLRDNTKVAVKIRRPMVEQSMMSDIAILKRLAGFARHTPQYNMIDFQKIIGELEISAKKELDFLNEAENIRTFQRNNRDVKFITSPAIFEEYTSDSVLVIGYVDGIKISDKKKLDEEGYDRSEICIKLANNYFKQIFEDGFFHADPHPGNVFVSEGKIVYIDFGMMGTLKDPMKRKFNSFLYAFVSADPDEMSRAVRSICIQNGPLDMQSFKADIESIYNEYIENTLVDLNLRKLIGDVLIICRNNHLTMPGEITMLTKGIITIESILEELAPDVKIMDILIPYFRNQMIKNIDIKEELSEYMMSLYLSARSLPKVSRQIVKTINNLSTGKAKIQMEHTNLEQPLDRLNHMVNRLVFAIIIASMILGSSMMAGMEAGPRLHGVSVIALIGYFVAVLMGLWMIVLIIRSDRKKK
ncbi:ABC1 kinase family protein [Parasporobacterium paucivorans]|uniref:Ubiquinone biosynthesis protein n=1 Tax=Parasporobacterium paucivorans DSM 15970 TaxID=1122934 RepID=A0A1M6DGE7_9FIRM|nr:lipopolysaccharide core heptose(II) kinase RfaY [Parasporobacterium paucivorans]SHI72250.1 ubiquinone biosynthesis protein [Parasporobacterium paucivorans DSM 15970]